MVRLIDCLDMAIVVDLDVKHKKHRNKLRKRDKM